MKHAPGRDTGRDFFRNCGALLFHSQLSNLLLASSDSLAASLSGTYPNHRSIGKVPLHSSLQTDSQLIVRSAIRRSCRD
jgi:hypothetical protein